MPGIGACRVGRQLALHQFRQRYTRPPPVTQKLMCLNPIESNATIERRYEALDRAVRSHCVAGDRLDGCEHVLDAMIELGNQLPLLCSSTCFRSVMSMLTPTTRRARSSSSDR